MRKRGDRDGWREQGGRKRDYGEEGGGGGGNIIEEIEQREGERRQELAEKAVTRVLLMCNETLHPGRDNRMDGSDGGRWRMRGGRMWPRRSG